MKAGFLLYPGLTQLDLTAPWEVFARTTWEVYLVSKRAGELVQADSKIRIASDWDLISCPQLDIVCVPGGLGCIDASEDKAYLEFLRRQARNAHFITSVCTGALILAAAGLLDGYSCTTHWQALDLLELFEHTNVDRERRVVIDRDRITAGGITSGIDFGLSVVSVIEGQDKAKQVQLEMEYNPEPPFSSGHPKQADHQTVAQVSEARKSVVEDRRRRLRLIIEARHTAGS